MSFRNIILQQYNCSNKRFQQHQLNLIAFLQDLRIEAQNNRLGSLFNQRIPQRQPNDTRYKVLTLDQKPFDYKKDVTLND